MSELLKIVIIAVLEGLTEFLPVSSSAHMLLAREYLHLDVSFDYLLVLQLAAYSALLVVLAPRMWQFLRSGQRQAVLMFLVRVALIAMPVGVIGFLAEDFVTTQLQTLPVIAAALILFSIVLAWADRRAAATGSDLLARGWRDYVVVGASQLLALIPGVSRSGSTLASGLSLGMTREVAAEFGFWLGMPLIIGAGLKGLWDLVRGGNLVTLQVDYLLIGFLVSFATALLVVKYLLRYLQTHDLRAFLWYRVILGLLILLLLL